MEPVKKHTANHSYEYYADMAIERIRRSKIAYYDSSSTMSIVGLRGAIRDLKDHKHFVREMEDILKQDKTKLMNLRKQDIG